MSRKRTGNRAAGAGGKGRTRRELLGDALRYAAAGPVGMGVAAAFSCRRPAPRPNAVVVLGMDGLDPDLLKKYTAEGRLLNFRRLMDQGWFSLLRTTWPPQSPMAWSTFITGKNPGGPGASAPLRPAESVEEHPAAAHLPFHVHFSSDQSAALIDICGERILLRKGDWSP